MELSSVAGTIDSNDYLSQKSASQLNRVPMKMNHANYTFAYFEFRASLNLWLGAIRRRCSSLCCVGERDPTSPPLHGAHLLIIRIPKATAEIRREKGIDAYGAEGSEARNARNNAL